jgi:hypothetical protein
MFLAVRDILSSPVPAPSQHPTPSVGIDADGKCFFWHDVSIRAASFCEKSFALKNSAREHQNVRRMPIPRAFITTLIPCEVPLEAKGRG